MIWVKNGQDLGLGRDKELDESKLIPKELMAWCAYAVLERGGSNAQVSLRKLDASPSSRQDRREASTGTAMRLHL